MPKSVSKRQVRRPVKSIVDGEINRIFANSVKIISPPSGKSKIQNKVLPTPSLILVANSPPQAETFEDTRPTDEEPFDEYDYLDPKSAQNHTNSDKSTLQLVLTKLEYLKRTVEDNKQMLLKILKKDTKSLNCTGKAITKFPITLEEDFLTFESTLAVQENADNTIGYLSGIGGDSAKDFTERVLSHMITDSLAMNFNWKGIKRRDFERKIGIESFRVIDIIYRSVQTKFLASTRSEIEGFVKTWFRYAKSRSTGKLKNT